MLRNLEWNLAVFRSFLSLCKPLFSSLSGKLLTAESQSSLLFPCSPYSPLKCFTSCPPVFSQWEIPPCPAHQLTLLNKGWLGCPIMEELFQFLVWVLRALELWWIAQALWVSVFWSSYSHLRKFWAGLLLSVHWVQTLLVGLVGCGTHGTGRHEWCALALQRSWQRTESLTPPTLPVRLFCFPYFEMMGLSPQDSHMLLKVRVYFVRRVLQNSLSSQNKYPLR